MHLFENENYTDDGSCKEFHGIESYCLESEKEKVYTDRIVLVNNQTITWYNNKKEVSFLEEIIREIVDADKKARHRVSEKKQECRNVQNLVQQRKEDIKKKYQDETKACVDKRRLQLDEELSQQLKQEQANYETAVAGLQKTYEDHKEAWVQQIFDRCLDL